MRNSTAATNHPPAHLQTNYRTAAAAGAALIEQSLRRNYFAGCPEGYLSTDWGMADLENHLVNRLDQDRKVIIPWLDAIRGLKDSVVLEIGCGTGCSTVALAAPTVILWVGLLLLQPFKRHWVTGHDIDWCFDVAGICNSADMPFAVAVVVRGRDAVGSLLFLLHVCGVLMALMLPELPH